MQSARLDNVSLRHGDWGPAYVLEGASSDIGLLVLRPGDEMTNHIHEHCDESFIVLEGGVTLWIDCRDRCELSVGDVYRCPPGEQHYFVNETDQTLRLVFVKSPSSPGDTINLPWSPGSPVPSIPTTERPDNG